jgi:hypothetical protein
LIPPQSGVGRQSNLAGLHFLCLAPGDGGATSSSSTIRIIRGSAICGCPSPDWPAAIHARRHDGQ